MKKLSRHLQQPPAALPHCLPWPPSEVLPLPPADTHRQPMEVQRHAHKTRRATAAIYRSRPGAGGCHRNQSAGSKCHSGCNSCRAPSTSWDHREYPLPPTHRPKPAPSPTTEAVKKKGRKEDKNKIIRLTNRFPHPPTISVLQSVLAQMLSV